jgi:hypothetical protein
MINGRLRRIALRSLLGQLVLPRRRWPRAAAAQAQRHGVRRRWRWAQAEAAAAGTDRALQGSRARPALQAYLPGSGAAPITTRRPAHEVPGTARREGEDDSRHRRLGAHVPLPVPVRHRRPGAQRLREGDFLVLRRPALPRAALPLRHHLGRGLVPGAVAVQQPHLHGAAGARRGPPHHQRLRLHLAGAGEGPEEIGQPRAHFMERAGTTTRTGTSSRPSGR